MGTWGSDAAYSLLTHYQPVDEFFGPFKEKRYKLFLRERWAKWHAACVWHCRRHHFPITAMSKRHSDRLRAVAKMLPRRTIRAHNLDDPFLAEVHWARKVEDRIQEHLQKREKNFKPGHKFYGNKYRRKS